MTKWYENIPKQGIPIHVNNDDFNEIIVFKPEHLERFTTDELDECTPLTAAEVWQLMPKQTMETAPRDGSFILIWCLHAWHIAYYDAENECFTSCEFLLLGAEKWQPLPTGDV